MEKLDLHRPESLQGDHKCIERRISGTEYRDTPRECDLHARIK